MAGIQKAAGILKAVLSQADYDCGTTVQSRAAALPFSNCTGATIDSDRGTSQFRPVFRASQKTTKHALGEPADLQ